MENAAKVTLVYYLEKDFSYKLAHELVILIIGFCFHFIFATANQVFQSSTFTDLNVIIILGLNGLDLFECL